MEDLGRVLVVYLLFWAFFGTIIGLLAARKNRNGLMWGFSGGPFGLFPIIVLALVPFLCPKCRMPMTNKEWKTGKCPRCGWADVRVAAAVWSGKAFYQAWERGSKRRERPPGPPPLAGAANAGAGEGEKIIRANAFILEDEKGQTRAVLSMSENGPYLSLVDENGKIRALLSVDKDGPALFLRDDKGQRRVGLGISEDRASLALYGGEGELGAGLRLGKDGPGLGLFDEKGEPRAGLRVTENGARLSLFDEKRKAIWSAP